MLRLSISEVQKLHRDSEIDGEIDECVRFSVLENWRELKWRINVN